MDAGIFDEGLRETADMLQTVLLHAALCGNKPLIDQLLLKGVVPTLELFRFLARQGQTLPVSLMTALLAFSYRKEMDGSPIDSTSGAATRTRHLSSAWGCRLWGRPHVQSFSGLRKWVIAVRLRDAWCCRLTDCTA
jgi:hypothetical protein